LVILKKKDVDIDNLFLVETSVKQVSVALERIFLNEKLSDSDRIYKILFNNSTDPILIIENNKFVDCNNAAVKLLQYKSKKELLNQHPADFSPEFQPDGESSMQKAEELLRLAYKKGFMNFEWVHKTKYGKKLFIDVSLSSALQDDKNVLFTVWKDNTQRYKEIKQLELEYELNRCLNATVPVGIMRLDNEGTILYMNKRAEEILTRDKQSLIGKKYDSAEWQILDIKGNPIQENPILNVFTTGEDIYSSKIIISQDAKSIHISLSASILRNNNDEKLGVVIAFEDITESIQTQNQLILAKQKAEEGDQLKSAFLANMSHEIRTPMNAILGFTELLAIQEISAEKKQKFIDIIHENGQQLLDLIDSILDLSKIESGQMTIEKKAFNLIELLELTYLKYKNLNKKENISFKLNLNNEKELILISDETKLKHVLDNLLSNAFKFTLEGEVTMGVYRKKGKVHCYVEDTGIGVPDKYKQKIFDRFVQAETYLKRKFGGTGLGLAIAISITELLEGELSLKDRDGGGSIFTISLPDPNAGRLTSEITKDQDFIEKQIDTSILQGKKILIAEDEIANYLLLKESLELHQMILYHAENGKQAVDFIKTNTVDAVLMDIKMPVLDGLEATREILKFNNSVPIIAQTAYAMNEDKNNALKAGCKYYISKPINQNELLHILCSTFGQNLHKSE
ncbi:MAG: hypothetical protein C0594_11670, partial [Marinilabiliales bacterium]